MSYQIPSEACHNNGEVVVDCQHQLMSMDTSTLTTTTTRREETIIKVPHDFPTLQEAVIFANTELSKSNGGIGGSRRRTIHVLIEPNHQCLVNEPIVVNYCTSSSNSQLVIDVVQGRQSPSDHGVVQHQGPQQAQVIMDTNIPNQPLIRLVRGNLTIRNIRFEHCSPVDMSILLTTKNCNAAIVVDPRGGAGDRGSGSGSCIQMSSPTKFSSSHGAGPLSLNLQHLTVTSYSGRGIINRCLTNPRLVQMEDVFMPRMWQ